MRNAYVTYCSVGLSSLPGILQSLFKSIVPHLHLLGAGPPKVVILVVTDLTLGGVGYNME